MADMADVHEAGVIQLDREAFTKTIAVIALRVPKSECHQYMQLLRG
jgi:hypothetical protein